ncbi:MAG: TIGR00266 family protein [archaeon]|nr:TIGR00266 family protein [archaeon]
MKYTITGSNLQYVNAEIQPGETLRSVAGAMVSMSGNVDMKSKMEGGLLAGLKRSLSGSSFMLVNFTAAGGPGTVSLAGNAPGKILDIDMGKGSWICQKTAYLCSEENVDVDLAFQKKLGSIFFGGEGLVLQKLSGTGMAFIHACGDFNIVDLAPGQVLKVSTSNAVAWEEGVSYDIASLGIKNALFGGEGLFVTTLTGPGKVVIQSMTLHDLAMCLYYHMPHGD